MVEDSSVNPEEVKEEYYSSLRDLTNNSKPMICMLTTLAEENIAHAQHIVDVIEEHLQKVNPEYKLPVLYLIDSICKNVNDPYLALFTKNLVNRFCSVFEKVNEEVRSYMWKMRDTWGTVFPQMKLYALDLRVHDIDPAWPVMKLPKNTSAKLVHPLQPERASPTPAAAVAPTMVKSMSSAKIPSVAKPTPTSNADMKSLLLMKRNKLVELQKQKVQLELLQAKANLEQQHKEQFRETPLKSEMPNLPKGALQPIVVPTALTTSKTIEKQFAGIKAPFKSEGSRSGLKIAPASSAAVAAVKSRDPRLKQSLPAKLDEPSILPNTNTAELLKQKHARMESLRMQRPIVPANDDKSLENRRTVVSQSKVTPSSTKTTNATTSQRSCRSTVKDQSKDSSSSRSSSSRSSGSSSSSRSSSSRKSGSKSRSKSSSESPPAKVIKLDDSPTNSTDKRPSTNKSSKSRKARSPSPSTTATSNGNDINSFRIPRRSHRDQLAAPNQINSSASKSPTLAKGAVDEKPVSPNSVWQSRSSTEQHLQSVNFKDVPSNARMRNYTRRNKDGSPEVVEVRKGSPPSITDASKDEDLRARGPIVLASSLDAKEDLDLRVLPGAKKPADLMESSSGKQRNADKFDALFGNEDVDLRPLTNPQAGPSPPRNPVAGDKTNKDDSWAKLKTHQQKPEREPSKPLSDRNRGRSQQYAGKPSAKEARRQRLGLKPQPQQQQYQQQQQQAERHDRNIAIIMKQAAEQLDAGSISKAQYNKLIQEVLHMSEDQKLRAAQRKEQELGMMVWERSHEAGNEENMQRAFADRPPRGPRWQNAPAGGMWQKPWPHPHGSPHVFANPPPPLPPHWQSPHPPPQFMGGPIRSDFPPPPMPPYMHHPGPRMGPHGPHSQPPRGPLAPMSNGPMSQPRPGPSSGTDDLFTATAVATGNLSSGELPPADPRLLEEIAKDTMKSINIDGVPREIRYYGSVGVVFIAWDDPRDIGFQDGVRRIFIDGKDCIVCKFNDDYKEFTYDGEIHRIKLGTPTRELYIDDKWYECYFGTRPIIAQLGNKKVSISLEGPPPQVKIGSVKRTDIVLGKINLIIDAKYMEPVFLDAKPQLVGIDGKPCTVEFTDALQTVLLNGRPFKVDFGGLPKPIILQKKKHFLRFTVLPRGFRAGYVKITGMRGEKAKETPSKTCTSAGGQSMSGALMASNTTNFSVPPGLDLDSSPRDDRDVSVSPGTDMHLEVLSSAVPSAMAPSSGLSYQAEIVEQPPAPAPAVNVPLNLNELFQRLVETGIVPALPNLEANNQPEQEQVQVQAQQQEPEQEQEQEEPEKEPDFPVSFDDPETLKVKHPEFIPPLYTGMQCSSCGSRFAPEMASRYSQHLDWHFRQNRKDKDAARKAQSRAWYFNIGDWTQFQEIEDVEDRAQSWFETERQNAETESGSGGESPTESQQPSVPAGSEVNSSCEVCTEAFEQFYNEEKEEWHLRPAVSFENKNYHPCCLEDHKRALEKSALEIDEPMDETANDIDDENLEESQDAAMDEIDEEKIVIKIEKGDIEVTQDEPRESLENILVKEEKVDIIDTKVEEQILPMEVEDSEPIEIIEPLPRKIELEEIEDSSDDEMKDEQLVVKKREPEEKIPDDVPLVFENVKVKEEPIDDDERVPEGILAEAKGVDTTQVAVKSSIDGNVELASAAPAMHTVPSKIKINITKPLNNPNKDLNAKKVKVQKPVESPVDVAPAKPLIPAAIKPALQGKKLSILPTIEKGHELSGLCSVM